MPRARRHASALLFVSASLIPAYCAGIESIDLSVGDLAGQGWKLSDASATLELSGEQPVLRIRAPAVMDDTGNTLATNLSLACRGAAVNELFIACPSGKASVVLPPAESPVETSLSFVLRRTDGRWRANGRAALGDSVMWTADGRDGGINAAIRADVLPLDELKPWLPHLPGNLVSLSGELTGLEATLEIPEDAPYRAELNLEGSGLGFDTASGLLAAAGFSGRLHLTWDGRETGWNIRAETVVDSGEFLAGTFYTSLGASPVEASGVLTVDNGRWRVDSLRLRDADAISLAGAATWDWDAEPHLQELDAVLETLQFPGFYGDYLQPLLAQYGFGDLATAGDLDGRMKISAGTLDSLSLSLNHVDISDSRDRLEFVDLNGGVRWHSRGEPVPSGLTWQEGRIYSIALGSADIRGEASGQDFRLTRQTLLPVLDGALVVNDLVVSDWFGEQPRLLFDARLMPISLGALSGALGWPELQGTLAGRIPELRFQDGVYRLGGSVAVDVFGGSVLVENLRLERPFGVLPKLVGDVRINDLDLEQITGVFTIGRITGRLAGYIDNLRLLDWEAVHFDARLATPADDDSEHRISQRAVDTLAELGGGGAGGTLSRTFLRIFDDFAYRQLGITCKLENNVCRMGGVKAAPGGGYYIVEGGGLPRVDVIGHVRRVDWPVLMDQLIQTMQGQTPSVGAPPGNGND